MFCPNCGAQNALGSRFCSSCGNSLALQPPGVYPQQSQLVRPRQPRMIAGVCSGLALHYGWDITIVRLVLVLCVLFAGTGILAYILAWIIIPEAPYQLPSQTP